jgi:hypothetical protein
MRRRRLSGPRRHCPWRVYQRILPCLSVDLLFRWTYDLRRKQHRFPSADLVSVRSSLDHYAPNYACRDCLLLRKNVDIFGLRLA